MALLERWPNDEVWRWPILAGLAILLGAGIGLFISSGSTDSPPAPLIQPATETATTSPASPEAAEVAPPEAAPELDSPLSPRNIVPAPPPMPKADFPYNRPAPGTAPPPLAPGDAKATRAEAERRAQQWVDQAMKIRPEVRKQFHAARVQERDQVLRQIDELKAGLAHDPNDSKAREDLMRLKELLYYYELTIERLEALQEDLP